MRKSRYKVTLDSAMYGHDATKWDTMAEAVDAVFSIARTLDELKAAGQDDGVRRVVRIVYRGKVLRRVEFGIGKIAMPGGVK